MINEAVPLTNRSRRIKCNTTAYPLAVISIWALQEVRIDSHFKATATLGGSVFCEDCQQNLSFE